MGARSRTRNQTGGEERIRTSGKELPLQPLSRRLPSATRPPLPYVLSWTGPVTLTLDARGVKPGRGPESHWTDSRVPDFTCRASPGAGGLDVDRQLHDLRHGLLDRLLHPVRDLVPLEDRHRRRNLEVHVRHVIETHLPHQKFLDPVDVRPVLGDARHPFLKPGPWAPIHQ